MTMDLIFYSIVFLYGLVIGSFLNVCIYRIPKGENLATKRSHCMNCEYQLKWYDLVPLFSWICLGGRCRKCKEKISIQYPLVELFNGILYLLVVTVKGFTLVSFIYCLMASALLVLAVIDFRTFEIPFGINVFLLTLGLIHIGVDYTNWLTYVIGPFTVGLFLWILILVTKGKAMGGGDMKLMAACGLLLGWKLIILAFLLGCILASVIHIIRMKLTKASHVLAFGPYLAAGIFISALFGEKIIQLYLSYIGF